MLFQSFALIENKIMEYDLKLALEYEKEMRRKNKMALYKQTLQGYKDIKCSEEEILVGEQA